MATDNKYDRQLRLWGAHGQVRLQAPIVRALPHVPPVLAAGCVGLCAHRKR